jgi:hypothetical protein
MEHLIPLLPIIIGFGILLAAIGLASRAEDRRRRDLARAEARLAVVTAPEVPVRWAPRTSTSKRKKLKRMRRAIKKKKRRR